MKSIVLVEDTLEETIKKAHSELGGDFFLVRQEEIIQKRGLFRKKKQIKAIFSQLEVEDVDHIKKKAIDEYEKIHLSTKNEDNNAMEEVFTAKLDELKSAMRGISLKMDSLDTKKLYSKPVQELERALKNQDTDADTISKIIRDVTMNLTLEEQNNTDEVFKYAKKHIEMLCNNVRSIAKHSNKQKISMFVGGTGVGKTSTVSKLATILQSSSNNRNSESTVGVITLDTFREGAIEQLRNLCNYTNIPVRVANSKESFKEALEAFASKDYIFIDTTGRSQHNVSDIRKIQDIIGTSFDYIDEVYLVISATTKYRDMVDIYDSFKWMNINRVVFSKLDETQKVGNILSFVDTVPDVALSYLTVGQRVPADIELVRPNKISELLLNQNTINQLI